MDVSPQGVQLVPPGLFDEDYEYFYADRLRPERSMLEADRIRRLGGLGPGQSVLDVPCGDGRIAALLGEAGCRVVGIDQNEDLIARAKSRSASGARFEVGDMRALGWREEFDCVLNWFGSFGYFDTDTNRRVLRGFCEVLRPAGRLIIDQVNPDRLRRDAERGGGTIVQMVDRGLDLMVDRVSILDGRSRAERFMVRDGRVRKIEFSLELVDDEQLESWLYEVGFETVRLFDQHGAPCTAASRRRVAVARRSDKSGGDGA